MSGGLTTTFRGLHRQCARDSGRRPRAAAARSQTARREVLAAVAHAAPAAGARGARRQHDPASPGVVGRAAQAEIQQDLAAGRLQAAVLQAGARQFRQGPDQARRDRRGDGRRCCGRSAHRLEGLVQTDILGTLPLDPARCRSSCWARWSRSSRSSPPPITCSSTGSGSSGRRCRCAR